MENGQTAQATPTLKFSPNRSLDQMEYAFNFIPFIILLHSSVYKICEQ